MSAVRIFIFCKIIVFTKIPAVHVVNIAVVVIIDSISRDLIFVNPNILGQIRMRDINTGICNTNNDFVLTKAF